MKKYYVSSAISLVFVVLVILVFVFVQLADEGIARNRKPEKITELEELSELCNRVGSAGKSALTGLDYDSNSSFDNGTLHISVISNSSKKDASIKSYKQAHYSDIKAYFEDDEFYCDVEGVFSLYIEEEYNLEYITGMFIVDYSLRLYSDDDVSAFMFERFNLSIDSSKRSQLCPVTIRTQINKLNQLSSDIRNHYTEWTSLDVLDSIFTSELSHCFEVVSLLGSAFSEENADSFIGSDTMLSMESDAFTYILSDKSGDPTDSNSNNSNKLSASFISPTEPSVETEFNINGHYSMKIDFSHINQTNVYQVANEDVADCIASDENKEAEE